MLLKIHKEYKLEIIVDLCNQHHGSLIELQRMALNAWSAGADIVKIQLIDSEKHFGTPERKYRDIDYSTFVELKRFCDNLNIEYPKFPGVNDVILVSLNSLSFNVEDVSLKLNHSYSVANIGS